MKKLSITLAIAAIAFAVTSQPASANPYSIRLSDRVGQML